MQKNVNGKENGEETTIHRMRRESVESLLKLLLCVIHLQHLRVDYFEYFEYTGSSLNFIIVQYSLPNSLASREFQPFIQGDREVKWPIAVGQLTVSWKMTHH